MRSYDRKLFVVNIAMAGDEDRLGLSYNVHINNPDDYARFLCESREIPGMGRIELFFDDERM